MARCKFCGNPMTDEAFALNNGMCDLCIRTAQGEDDPLVVRAEPEPMPAPKVVEVENPFAFKPKNFDGKSIEEYDFQGVISSEIVDCPDTKEGKALLLTTHKELTSSEKIKEVVPTALVAAFLCAFGSLPLVVIKSSDSFFIWIWVIVFNGIGLYSLWNGIVKKFWFFDWVLLKDNSIECCRGNEFSSKRADKYYFDDIAAFYTKRVDGKGNAFHSLEISQPSKDMNLKRHAFTMDLETQLEAEFWQDFLNWYIKRNCVGGFGSATSHGQGQ